METNIIIQNQIIIYNMDDRSLCDSQTKQKATFPLKEKALILRLVCPIEVCTKQVLLQYTS